MGGWQFRQKLQADWHTNQPAVPATLRPGPRTPATDRPGLIEPGFVPIGILPPYRRKNPARTSQTACPSAPSEQVAAAPCRRQLMDQASRAVRHLSDPTRPPVYVNPQNACRSTLHSCLRHHPLSSRIFSFAASAGRHRSVGDPLRTAETALADNQQHCRDACAEKRNNRAHLLDSFLHHTHPVLGPRSVCPQEHLQSAPAENSATRPRRDLSPRFFRPTTIRGRSRAPPSSREPPIQRDDRGESSWFATGRLRVTSRHPTAKAVRTL